MHRIRHAIVLVLLLAVCASAYFQAGLGRAAASAAAESAAPAKPDYPGAPGVFVPLGMMTFPVIREGRIRGRISLDIIIEVAPDQDHRVVMDAMRRLQDAFNVEMNMLLGLDWPAGVTVDLEVARSRLLQRARRVAGREVVAGLFFQWVQDRRS